MQIKKKNESNSSRLSFNFRQNLISLTLSQPLIIPNEYWFKVSILCRSSFLASTTEQWRTQGRLDDACKR